MSAGRIAHLTSVHGRSDVRIYEKEAVSLARAGYETFIVVGDGAGSEVRGDVRILDVGAAPAGRLARMVIQPWRILRAALRLRALLYHFHDPELIFTGLVLRSRGAEVIYDSHEDLPRAILSKDWVPEPLRPMLAGVVRKIENFAAKRFSAVVAATPSIERRFATVSPISIAIHNFPRLEELTVVPDITKAPRTVCYIGGIGLIRGAVEMIRALELVDARLVMAGPFESETTEATLRALPGWHKVDYRGVVSREGVRQILAESQAGLLFFHPVPNHIDAQPNKMFEYMAAGLPVLASDFPLWRELLVETGAGKCANPLEPTSIARLIGDVLDDPKRTVEMGRRGRCAVSTLYHWDAENAKLQDLYARIMA